MVHQSRDKKSRSSVDLQKNVTQKRLQPSMNGWRSNEFVKSRIGAEKLDKWIEAGVIKMRPDPKTVSNDKCEVIVWRRN